MEKEDRFGCLVWTIGIVAVCYFFGLPAVLGVFALLLLVGAVIAMAAGTWKFSVTLSERIVPETKSADARKSSTGKPDLIPAVKPAKAQMKRQWWVRFVASLLSMGLGSCVIIFVATIFQPTPNPVPPELRSLPEFEWPLPDPSKWTTIPLRNLTLGQLALRKASIGDLEDGLTALLMKSGYQDNNYYSVPGGFVLCTRIDQIADDGSVITTGREFLPPLGFSDTSLRDYAREILRGRIGRFRLLVFLVTDKISDDPPGQPRYSEALEWAKSGAKSTGDLFDIDRVTSSTYCLACVYEFVQPGKGNPHTFVRSSEIDISAHLPFVLDDAESRVMATGVRRLRNIPARAIRRLQKLDRPTPTDGMRNSLAGQALNLIMKHRRRPDEWKLPEDSSLVGLDEALSPIITTFELNELSDSTIGGQIDDLIETLCEDDGTQRTSTSSPLQLLVKQAAFDFVETRIDLELQPLIDFRDAQEFLKARGSVDQPALQMNLVAPWSPSGELFLNSTRVRGVDDVILIGGDSSNLKGDMLPGSPLAVILIRGDQLDLGEAKGWGIGDGWYAFTVRDTQILLPKSINHSLEWN